MLTDKELITKVNKCWRPKGQTMRGACWFVMPISAAKRVRQRENRRMGGDAWAKTATTRKQACVAVDNVITTCGHESNHNNSWRVVTSVYTVFTLEKEKRATITTSEYKAGDYTGGKIRTKIDAVKNFIEKEKRFNDRNS